MMGINCNQNLQNKKAIRNCKVKEKVTLGIPDDSAPVAVEVLEALIDCANAVLP